MSEPEPIDHAGDPGRGSQQSILGEDQAAGLFVDRAALYRTSANQLGRDRGAGRDGADPVVAVSGLVQKLAAVGLGPHDVEVGVQGEFAEESLPKRGGKQVRARSRPR